MKQHKGIDIQKNDSGKWTALSSVLNYPEFKTLKAAKDCIDLFEERGELGNLLAREQEITDLVEKKLKPTPEMVKKSNYGCKNCLYNGCECRGMSKFKPKWDCRTPTCGAYVYYD